MTSRKTDAGGWLGALEDPEGARVVGELLESLCSLAGRMGGAEPIIDALARSFALMPNADARGEYDQIRRELIRYLRSLDAGGRPSGGEPQVELERSPAISAEEQEALSKVLLAITQTPTG